MTEPVASPQIRKRVLVVDDEAGIRESLRFVLRDSYDVAIAASGHEALAMVRDFAPDLVLLDVVMPDLDGIAVLERIRADHDAIAVVMLSAVTNIQTVVDAVRRGADDYVGKPFDLVELKLTLERALEKRSLCAEVKRLRGELAERFSFDRIIGRAKAMRAVYDTIEQVADRRTTVLVRGESGTGKELVARAVHYNGSRRDQPFVVVNCAAIPEQLLESQLFGHERGAFTDARERRIGQFQAADGGTIFLDEIGELPLSMQAKLLRVLQEREVVPVGSNRAHKVDIRVVAATNLDLEVEVSSQRFRTDLYYRLNVVQIELPPLRERREDIPILIQHFVHKYAEKQHLAISPGAIDTMVAYDWPGNVRELENTIERLAALAPGGNADVEHLPLAIIEGGREARLRGAVRNAQLTFDEAVAALESGLIRDALREAHGNQSAAATRLGISRRILKYKLDKYAINLPPS